jgi:hypothetical protein
MTLTEQAGGGGEAVTELVKTIQMHKEIITKQDLGTIIFEGWITIGEVYSYTGKRSYQQ